jgi:hypothetical protein
MAKQPVKGKSKARRIPKYEQVSVASLGKGRRGKHHTLITDILRDLETLPKRSAIKIPFAGVNGVTLANLRSAIHRATTAKRLRVETSSDEHNFYIWKL